MNNQICRIVEELRNLKITDTNQYAVQKKLLYSNFFNQLPIFGTTIPKGSLVYRSVPIFRSDLSIGRKKYISYRPSEIEYPYFNRCSEPNQQHFYCSDDRWLSMTECSYFISKSEEIESGIQFEKDTELIEVGVWRIEEEIMVADLTYGSYSPQQHESKLTARKEYYEKIVNDDCITDLFHYINSCFETPIRKNNHWEYWFTASISNYLFEDKYKTQTGWGNIPSLDTSNAIKFQGITYHSVKGIKASPPLKGCNIVFPTYLIDSGKIKLIGAGIFETKQLDSKTFILDELKKIKTDITMNAWCYNDYKG